MTIRFWALPRLILAIVKGAFIQSGVCLGNFSLQSCDVWIQKHVDEHLTSRLVEMPNIFLPLSLFKM